MEYILPDNLRLNEKEKKDFKINPILKQFIKGLISGIVGLTLFLIIFNWRTWFALSLP